MKIQQFQTDLEPPMVLICPRTAVLGFVPDQSKHLNFQSWLDVMTKFGEMGFGLGNHT